MDYKTNLLEVKEQFPFDDWKLSGQNMPEYSEENCEAAKRILDTLVSDLIALGEEAREEDKIHKFQIAVEALNTLNDETDIIMTGEREELVDLFNLIAVKAGIDPDKYGGGEGLASEWRDW